LEGGEVVKAEVAVLAAAGGAGEGEMSKLLEFLQGVRNVHRNVVGRVGIEYEVFEVVERRKRCHLDGGTLMAEFNLSRSDQVTPFLRKL
jgi:hypothetical protein